MKRPVLTEPGCFEGMLLKGSIPSLAREKSADRPAIIRVVQLGNQVDSVDVRDNPRTCALTCGERPALRDGVPRITVWLGGPWISWNTPAVPCEPLQYPASSHRPRRGES